ncbi:MAG: hypothetical protein ABSC41_06030 [Acidimicrobiales bacterium]|jgi:hypothetical protein
MTPAMTERAAFPVHNVSSRIGRTAGPGPPRSSAATGEREPGIVVGD